LFKVFSIVISMIPVGTFLEHKAGTKNTKD